MNHFVRRSRVVAPAMALALAAMTLSAAMADGSASSASPPTADAVVTNDAGPIASPAQGIADSVHANPAGRIYIGYYPSWSDNPFDSRGMSPDDVYRASRLARIPGTYTHVMLAFADPSFRWDGKQANSWFGTGLRFRATPRDIRYSIDVLHQRNFKVILSVGGAKYGNWGALAAEGANGGGPIIDALASFISDMGIDGLDVDYEVDDDIDHYAQSIKALRIAADKAGEGRLLALAGRSSGANCTAATTDDPACAGRVSVRSEFAGRERRVLRKYPEVADMLDMVGVMTYDARYEHFDGVTAYADYRNLLPSRTSVSIGFQTSPEGWPGGNLVVRDADAQCTGSQILQDQYGAAVNLPYSVERYTQAVLQSPSANRNEHDGAMLWSILKKATGTCGSAPLATPGTIGSLVAAQLGLPDDPLLQTDEWR